ncbi:hypothetical protein, partial [Mycobacterium ulcerans]
RRSLPDHRFDRQPPPRPPQSTIPQLTSLLINNAGALSHSGFAPVCAATGLALAVASPAPAGGTPTLAGCA